MLYPKGVSSPLQAGPDAVPGEVAAHDQVTMWTMIVVFGIVPVLWLICGAMRDAWRVRDRAWRLPAASAAVPTPKLPRARALRR